MHFRLLRKLGVCFQLKSLSLIIYQKLQSACYNSLRNYKLTFACPNRTLHKLLRS